MRNPARLRLPDMERKLYQPADNPEPASLLPQWMNQEWSHLVYVKSSPIEGLGLFARRSFSTSETVLVREERPLTPEQPLELTKGELQQHCERAANGNQVYLGFPARFLNHSCDPNVFLRFEGGVGQIIALRPIRPHEEIASHYGVNLSDGLAWRCSCASPRCIDVIPGNFFRLPADVQLELSPFLSEWFVQEHAQEYSHFLRTSGLSEELAVD